MTITKLQASRLILLSILIASSLASATLQQTFPVARAQTYSNNIILNSGFEEGLGANNYPRFWINWTKHGGPTCSTTPACISLDNSRYVTGSTSAKLDLLDQIDIGFISIAQTLPSSLTFRNLTDRSDGLDMWFYYTQKYAGPGDVRIRVLYGENVAELDYIFDPDPALGYPNSTATASVWNSTCACLVQLPGGVKNIFLRGYPENQWHHVRLNLRADWAAPLYVSNRTFQGFVRGFSLDIPFPRIQFDALALCSQRDMTGQCISYLSETAWIDDFKICADSQTQSSTTSCDQPPPPANHWIDFTTRDLDGNDVTSKVKWKLFNNIDQEIAYTLGQPSLPGNYTYTIKIYYPTDIGQTPEPYLIYQSTVPLDNFQTINLPMKAQSPSSTLYIAFNNPVISVRINQFSSTTLNFTADGNPATSYTIIIDALQSPLLVVKDDVSTYFSYDSAHSTVTMRTDGLGEFTLFFSQPPPQIPQIDFKDLSQQPVQIGTVKVNVVDPSGNQIDYQPGKIIGNGTYYFTVEYKGRQIHRDLLPSTGTSSLTLSMIPLQIVPGGYAAFNTTATSTNKSETSSQIDITIVGKTPLLLIVDLPSKPVSVQQNGQKITSWSYDETTKTLELSSAIDGTFTIILQEKSNLLLYLITGGVLAILFAIVILAVRRRRKGPTLP